MYLMIDVVVNHMASTALPPSLNYSMYEPFSDSADFHPFCFVTDYANQTDVEQCWLGDKSVPLPDINTESEMVQSTIYAWIKNLVGVYGADGLRIDTVKHVRKNFWPGFAEASGVFTIGEVCPHGAHMFAFPLRPVTSFPSRYSTTIPRMRPPTHVSQLSRSLSAPHTPADVLDSILDYPNWFPLVSAFSTPQGNFSALTASVLASQSAYKNGTFMTGSFLENHDQPRFQSLTQDQSVRT
jgi:alpha-amylase